MNINKNTNLKGWTGVYLTSKEIDSLRDWTHACEMDVQILQTGSSGIGINTVVRCKCGSGKDITDYGAW